VRDELERVFGGADEKPLALEGELAAYARARDGVVTTLVADVADAARAEGVSVAFMDLSGAIKGYATGRPSGEAAASIAWQLGIDLPASVDFYHYGLMPLDALDRIRAALSA
jgi:hypothetical protein